MIAITDRNIIISAILTPNSLISKIIFDKNIQFVAPNFIIDEIKNHQIK
jgi:predicted nucleic acid-binding protein